MSINACYEIDGQTLSSSPSCSLSQFVNLEKGFIGGDADVPFLKTYAVFCCQFYCFYICVQAYWKKKKFFFQKINNLGIWRRKQGYDLMVVKTTKAKVFFSGLYLSCSNLTNYNPLFRTPEEEYSENLHKISLLMRSEVGLLCTNEKTEDVLEFFGNLSAPDYAR